MLEVHAPPLTWAVGSAIDWVASSEVDDNAVSGSSSEKLEVIGEERDGIEEMDPVSSPMSTS